MLRVGMRSRTLRVQYAAERQEMHSDAEHRNENLTAPPRKAGAGGVAERLCQNFVSTLLWRVAMHLEIFDKYERKIVKSGAVIFRENDPGDVMYIIFSGRVAISKQVMEKVTKMLNVLEAGEYFGEMSLLLKASRTATARAIEDTELIEISRDKFKLVLQEHYEVGVNLLIQLAHRLEKANEEAILAALELELSKRKPTSYLSTVLPSEQVIVATGSFEAKNLQEILRLRKELYWDRETNVIASLIKPGQLQDALLYILQTDDIREVMKLTACFKPAPTSGEGSRPGCSCRTQEMRRPT